MSRRSQIGLIGISGMVVTESGLVTFKAKLANAASWVHRKLKPAGLTTFSCIHKKL